MKIVIFGASRGIGYQLLKLALEQGHEVTALLRNPNKLKIDEKKYMLSKATFLTLPVLQMLLLVKIVFAYV